MDNIENTLTRIRKICKFISIVLLVVLVLISIWWFLSVILMAVSLAGFDYSDDNEATPLSLFLLIGHSIVSGVLLFVLYRIFSETAKGQSPFTMIQVKRLRIIAVLLLLYALFDSAVSFEAPYLHFGLAVGNHFTVGNDSIFAISFTPLVVAAVVYAFSFVFKYGVLLQEESDATI